MMGNTHSLLDGLNPQQMQAVTLTSGNMLILAGAGSGGSTHGEDLAVFSGTLSDNKWKATNQLCRVVNSDAWREVIGQNLSKITQLFTLIP